MAIPRTRQDWFEVLRFGLVGGVATLSYLVFTVALVEMGVTPTLSSAIAYTFCIVISFLGHRLFTFRSNNAANSEFGRFLTMSVVSLATSTLGMKLITQAGLHYAFGVAFTLLAVPAFNFVWMKLIVFTKTT